MLLFSDSFVIALDICIYYILEVYYEFKLKNIGSRICSMITSNHFYCLIVLRNQK